MERTYLVKCKHCGNNQKFTIRKGGLHNKSKQCVYCGKRFNVYKSINNNQLVKSNGGTQM